MSVDVVIPYKYRKFLDEELSLIKTVYPEINEVLMIRKPNPKYYLTLNKIDIVKNSSSQKIILMDRVKPSQIINLMRETRKEIIDRILLILEIFAQHAGSKEAKLQIELARLKHQLPLIKETIRYAKLGELHGFLGAGRYGYEKYYRMMREREARVRRELEKLRSIRSRRREHRRQMGYPHISIIGYTCAGKTTLFNRLTHNLKPIGPEPFTTLSPKSSALVIDGLKMILTDTVGFIRDLPHEIIEAFYATLEEIIDSNIIIHVIDASKSIEAIIKEIVETRRIFERIGVHGIPIIIALNKIDLLNSDEEIKDKMRLVEKYVGENSIIVPISAINGKNTKYLLNILKEIMRRYSIENLRSKIWSQTRQR
ncbi:GTPase HflX [Staphylothermus hellenicus]|uniref:GTPase HflX n=1 Tax=Staphylothermus hellenicus (strain DSM 12710 / JCM 10830 / BK20S6-10-b1 / P8) TaxID=591019 RepID=D7DA41_STAHD|nr:GTPase HflX [Staphylothermus hellenicus]ADI32637.1 GTP-binding proten HflX [Staphylothermus hellenicus DSM 12710]